MFSIFLKKIFRMSLRCKFYKHNWTIYHCIYVICCHELPQIDAHFCTVLLNKCMMYIFCCTWLCPQLLKVRNKSETCEMPSVLRRRLLYFVECNTTMATRCQSNALCLLSSSAVRVCAKFTSLEILLLFWFGDVLFWLFPCGAFGCMFASDTRRWQ